MPILPMKSIGKIALEGDAPFWKYMDIWISKPLFYLRNCGGVEFIFLNFEPELLSDFVRKLQDEKEAIASYDQLKETVKRLEKEFQDMEALIGFANYTEQRPHYLMLRIAYPKSGLFRPDLVETIKCDFTSKKVLFAKALVRCETQEQFCCYEIALEVDCVNYYTSSHHTECSEMKRLFRILSRKLELWAQQGLNDQQQITSHKLVPTGQYISLYNKLKEKYAAPTMAIWTESTDPKKAIHQAISIATYLILIWGETPQTFIDLGCGTGLLVHILNSENHKGRGIDVRSRKIWSSYPPTCILEEGIISADDVFLDADWIIGNHSDELTPLVAPIAARSSYKTNFFLLPCCPYEFDGRKYQRADVSQSQYRSYLDYIEKVCTTCGFVVTRDRMKIPSTKRICFVSQGRNYPEAEHEMNNDRVLSFLRDKCQKLDKSGNYVSNVKTREKEEKVRNCTRLDKDLVSSIVSKVAQIVLESRPPSQDWNEGSPVKMSDIIQHIPQESLAHLKQECGGLQTLLRNHHFIFLVVKGQVKFRKPAEKKQKPENWKQKQCWFYNNHPQSCPLDDDSCSFIHEQTNTQ